MDAANNPADHLQSLETISSSSSNLVLSNVSRKPRTWSPLPKLSAMAINHAKAKLNLSLLTR